MPLFIIISSVLTIFDATGFLTNIYAIVNRLHSWIEIVSLVRASFALLLRYKYNCVSRLIFIFIRRGMITGTDSMMTATRGATKMCLILFSDNIRDRPCLQNFRFDIFLFWYVSYTIPDAKEGSLRDSETGLRTKIQSGEI